MAGCVIRRAVQKDCGNIVGLIKGIAGYEKMADEVSITKEDLERDGFGPEKLFGCFVAELPDAGSSTLVGYAFHYNVYSTFKGKSMYLEDLFVYPEHRGKGIGKALIKAVAKEAVETGCHRMDFIVLNWNKDAQGFYKSLHVEDVTDREGWNLFRMQNEHLVRFGSS